MERVTFWIAVAGFVMSSLTWLRELCARKNRIEVEAIDYTQHLNATQLFLRINNKSSQPSSIGKIEIKSGDRWVACELEPKRIKATSAGLMVYTPQFPLNLEPQSYSAVYLEFLSCSEIQLEPGKRVVLQIHTSRGMLTEALLLQEPGRYLHIGH